MSGKTIPVEIRFWGKVAKTQEPGACWIWTAGVFTDGYGVFRVKGKNWRAHRFVYFLEHGEIPRGMCILHHCDNPLCVNPQHLFPGTPLDNAQDAVKKGRTAKGDKNGSRLYPEKRQRGAQHWSKKHPSKVIRGEKHGNAILTETQVLQIRAQHSQGKTAKELASNFRIKKAHVYGIINRIGWKHI